MTDSKITPATTVTILKHLVAGHDLNFVAGVTHLERGDVLDLVSSHGYPDVDKMAWAVDVLTKKAGEVPAGASRTRFKAFEPTVVKPTPPADIVVRATDSVLNLGKHSPKVRTRTLAAKIHTLLDDLTNRLADETAAREANLRAAKELVRNAARIAELEAELATLKGKTVRKPAKAKQTHTTRSVGNGGHPCPTCPRIFDTGQGVSLHQRRTHPIA